MFNTPEEMNMSKYDFNELLQETLEEITLHCGLLVVKLLTMYQMKIREKK